MGMKVRKGGAWQDIVSGHVFAHGSWRDLIQIKVYKSGAWRTVANFTAPAEPPPSGGGGGGGSGGGGGGTITVSVSPTSVAVSGSIVTLSSDPITATPSGGRAPYTYSWAVVSHDLVATYSFSAPTAATTRVKAVGQDPGTIGECTVRCTVTDALGTTATTSIVDCQFTKSSTPIE